MTESPPFMGLWLQPIENNVNSHVFLWALLKERDIETVGISHKGLPTYEEHRNFVRNHPYIEWHLIRNGDGVVGSIYLTAADEIGVFIFRSCQRQGCGSWAVRAIMNRHPEVKRFRANISPRNAASMIMFQSLHFNVLQMTLVRENPNGQVSQEAGRVSGEQAQSGAQVKTDSPWKEAPGV